jgi:hypothetical protein
VEIGQLDEFFRHQEDTRNESLVTNFRTNAQRKLLKLKDNMYAGDQDAITEMRYEEMTLFGVKRKPLKAKRQI